MTSQTYMDDNYKNAILHRNVLWAVAVHMVFIKQRNCKL